MTVREETIQVGSLLKTHGVSGQLVAEFYDASFADPTFLFLEIDGLLVPFRCEEMDFISDTEAVVSLSGVTSREEAASLCKMAVYLPSRLFSEGAPIGPRSWRAYRGFQVWEERHGLLGKVKDIDDSTQNLLLYVDSEKDGREIIIPLHEDFYISQDLAARSITLSVPDDLLTLND